MEHGARRKHQVNILPYCVCSFILKAVTEKGDKKWR